MVDEFIDAIVTPIGETKLMARYWASPIF